MHLCLSVFLPSCVDIPISIHVNYGFDAFYDGRWFTQGAKELNGLMATVKELGTQLWFQLQALRDADRKPRYNEDTKRFLVTVEAGIHLQVK